MGLLQKGRFCYKKSKNVALLSKNIIPNKPFIKYLVK